MYIWRANQRVQNQDGRAVAHIVKMLAKAGKLPVSYHEYDLVGHEERSCLNIGKLKEDGDRDISEIIALNLPDARAKAGASGETAFDHRLYDTTKNQDGRAVAHIVKMLAKAGKLPVSYHEYDLVGHEERSCLNIGKLKEDGDRDISEIIALNLPDARAKAGASGETAFDHRLYDTTKNQDGRAVAHIVKMLAKAGKLPVSYHEYDLVGHEERSCLNIGKLKEDGDRDISEIIALNLPDARAKAGASGETAFDHRLYDTTKGLDSGGGLDDETYAAYDKPWRSTEAISQSIYRPRKDMDSDIYGADLDKLINTNRFVADKPFAGAAGGGGGGEASRRDGPVQFEKQQQPAAAEEDDPFGLGKFLDEAKRGHKRGSGGGTGGDGDKDRDSTRRK